MYETRATAARPSGTPTDTPAIVGISRRVEGCACAVEVPVEASVEASVEVLVAWSDDGGGLLINIVEIWLLEFFVVVDPIETLDDSVLVVGEA